ncbi:MAG: hypothetical protein M1835_004750 [Candelina submexicana]|nr:MAG: hypothetical protein M1835_004750 [Candelina submexicana]
MPPNFSSCAVADIRFWDPPKAPVPAQTLEGAKDRWSVAPSTIPIVSHNIALSTTVHPLPDSTRLRVPLTDMFAEVATAPSQGPSDLQRPGRIAGVSAPGALQANESDPPGGSGGNTDSTGESVELSPQFQPSEKLLSQSSERLNEKASHINSQGGLTSCKSLRREALNKGTPSDGGLRGTSRTRRECLYRAMDYYGDGGYLHVVGTVIP